MPGKAQRSGRLIVLEGTDGSGKGTQTGLLAARLRAGGVPTETVSFPQYDASFFGGLVGRYLRGEFGPSGSVDPYLASVLFALDRWEARDRLIGWLNSGRVVIADRYVSANAGHQSIKIERPPDREAFLAWVERMEYDVFGLPRPDMVILLHMPWRHAQELVARKPDRAYLHGSRRDIHEADPEHLRRAEEAYLLMAQRHPEWRRIECVSGGVVLAPEEIGDLVWREVRPLVGDKTA